jgi:hypothetical protein
MQTRTAVIKKNYPRKISMYAIVTLLLLVGAAYYSYLQYTKLTLAQTAIQAEQEQADLLASAGDQYAKDFGNMQTAFESDYKTTIEAIKAVLPANEDYTVFTRQLDTYILGNDTVSNPIFNPNLSFGTGQYPEGKDYAVLPFSMSIDADKTNFDKFLRYAENSGSLEDKTRLMDIRSISLSLPLQEEPTAEAAKTAATPQKLTINFSLNTYFQKPTAQAN